VNYAQLLIPDFSLILGGYLLCRHTPLNRTVWDQVEVLVYYLLFPVLLFQSIARSPLDLKAASGLIAAVLLLALTAIAASYALPYLPGLRKHIHPRDHAAAAQVAFRFNTFIGLALAQRLGGPVGLQLIAVLIGVCVPIYNVAAVWPMARHAGLHMGRELLRNPLIIATVSGLVANVVGLRIPDWLDPSLQRVGSASVALGLMAAGAGLRLGSMGRAKCVAVAVLAIKHVLLPVTAWLLARVFGLTPMQTTILLAFAALPTASSCYVLATRMGYDGAHVAGLVTVSTLLGMLSLPLALGVLRTT
jgi:predicted permease